MKKRANLRAALADMSYTEFLKVFGLAKVTLSRLMQAGADAAKLPWERTMGDEIQNYPRLTTGEAARLLNCEQAEALLLLRAAGVSYTRFSKRAPYLWNAAEVQRLMAALKPTGAPTTPAAGATDGGPARG